MKKIAWILLLSISCTMQAKKIFFNESGKRNETKLSRSVTIKETDPQGGIPITDYEYASGVVRSLTYYKIDMNNFMAADLYWNIIPDQCLKFNAQTTEPVMILYNNSSTSTMNVKEQRTGRTVKLAPKQMNTAVTMPSPAKFEVTAEKDGKKVGASNSAELKPLNGEWVNIIFFDIKEGNAKAKPDIKAINWREADSKFKAFNNQERFKVVGRQEIRKKFDSAANNYVV